MKITRYEPLNMLNQFYADLNELFEKQLPDTSRIATGQWAPAVDIKEEANQFVIHADLPGVKAEDIEVTMENGVLTIKGKRETESKIEEKDYTRIERISGSFYRRFSLPDSADQDNVRAEVKNGVLTLIIAKKEKSKPKKITVKSENSSKNK